MKHLLIILFSFLITAATSAQYTNVLIDNSHSPEEVSIVINPKNLNQLVAGSNISNCHYSTNGGLNWSWLNLTSTYGVYGDPIVMCDTMGYFYYFHLSNPSSGNWIDRMVCQKSTNAGVSWSNGTYTGLNYPKEEDKPGVVIDRKNNYIYITWTEFDYYGTTNQSDSSRILFSKSTDGGLTWSTPVRIDKLGGDCYDSDNTAEGAVPATGPNGELYVAWAGPKVRNSQYGIFLNKSTDKGVTWLANPIYVCDQPGGWDYNVAGIYRCNGLPATCCDASNGPYSGNIYINWTDSAGVNDHDVKFIKSTNGGTNWSSVKRVNNDAAGKEQFFSWMTVDQYNGHIYIVFYDRRNYSDNNTDVYIARSTDGGETFSNFVVSSSSFIPGQGTFFGDYNGITAYAGVVRPIWTRLVGGSLSIWTAIVNFTTGINNSGIEVPYEYKLSQNYPNPFNPSTTISYEIKQNSFVSLKVYDILGKEIAVIENSFKTAGRYEINFLASEYNLSSGIYYYKITARASGSPADDFSDTKMMVLTK